VEHSSSSFIIPGIELDATGHANVSPVMGQRLIELAIALEPHTPHPVDVQHVLAAIILAVRGGELPAGQPLRDTDAELCEILAGHVNELFQRSGGRVARDE
jgi:hypothetical protein